ncbi:hypothetical protein QE152_g6888 [Popillia japonica]|uniref:Uncharacterized protein n=1 Tax=Popillia japonica TaxID=7064 RepID=A0AAW1MGZ5_POPJA
METEFIEKFKIETILTRRLEWILENNRALHSNQWRSRKGKGTTEAANVVAKACKYQKSMWCRIQHFRMIYKNRYQPYKIGRPMALTTDDERKLVEGRVHWPYKIGRPMALTTDDERKLVEGRVHCAKQGYPLLSPDVRNVVYATTLWL